MKTFAFRILKVDDGICFMGTDPDHITPMEIINNYVGQDILEIRGTGIGVNLYMNDDHALAWEQNIAFNRDVWISADPPIFSINLDKMRKPNQHIYSQDGSFN